MQCAHSHLYLEMFKVLFPSFIPQHQMLNGDGALKKPLGSSHLE